MTISIRPTAEQMAQLSQVDKLVVAARKGNFTNEVLEAIGLDRANLVVEDPQERAELVVLVRNLTAEYQFTQAVELADSLGLFAMMACSKGDASSFLRYTDLYRQFPNLELGFPEWESKILSGEDLVLPVELTRSIELEALKLLYCDGQVRTALTELEEEPNVLLPQNLFQMRQIGVSEVLYLVKCLGGRITPDLKYFEIWGIRVDIQEYGYILNRRAEVRSSLAITKCGSQMLDPHQSMYVMLSATDSVLCRGIDAGRVRSKNYYNSYAAGWIMVAMANMVRFNGNHFTDEVRGNLEFNKFQAIGLGFGPYGLEVTVGGHQAKQDLWKQIYEACPTALAEPQAKYFTDIRGLNLDVVQTPDDLEVILDKFQDRFQESEAETLMDAMDEGDILVGIPSMDEKKFMKRILNNKCAAMEPHNKSLSMVVTNNHQTSTGVAAILVVAPTLLPEFSGGLGAIPALVSRDEVSQLLAFRSTTTLNGVSTGIKNDAADLDNLFLTLPKVGETLKSGQLLEVLGCPLPVKVKANQVGTVSAVRALRDTFNQAHWTVEVISDESVGEAKLRGSVKGMVNYPGTGNLMVEGAEGHFLAGMDALKATGKGNSEFRVNMAAMTLAANWRESWTTKIHDLVASEDLFEGETTFVVFSPLRDKLGAYDKLVKAFEAEAGRVIKVTRRLPKQDWLDIAELYNVEFNNLVSNKQGDQEFESVTKVIGKGFNDHREILEFTHIMGEVEVFLLTQETWGFQVVDIVKIESIQVSKAVTQVGSMLEVAHSAQAAGCNKLASMLELGGQSGIDSLEHMLQLLNLAIDDNGQVTIPVSGTERLPLTKVPTWKHIITLNSDIIGKGISSELTSVLTSFATSDVDDWSPDVVFVCQDRSGNLVGFDQAVLSDFARGTENGGPLETIRALFGYAIKGEVDIFAGLTTKLRITLEGIVNKSEGIYKRLMSRCSVAISAKRTAVFAVTDRDHRKVFLNRSGRIARMLARQFKCKISDLAGKTVIGYRAPQFMFVALEITFDSRVGINEIGHTSRVAALDQGDFDGDTYYLVPILDNNVEVEVWRFDSFAYAKKIHQVGAMPNIPEPWIKSNLFEADKAKWAKTQLVRMGMIRDLSFRAIKNQTQDMPMDANRSHSLLVESSLKFSKDGWIGGNDLDAQAMMMYVYEPQLAGFSYAWDKMAEVIAEKDSGRTEEQQKDYFISLASSVEISQHLAGIWWDRVKAHRNYTKIESKTANVAFNDEGQFVVKNFVGAKASDMVRRRLVWNLIAGAVKRLSQGCVSQTRFPKLLRNLPNLVVLNMTLEEVNGEQVEFPYMVTRTRLSGDGTVEVRVPEAFQVMELVRQLANKNNPGCLRLVAFVDRILPLVESLRSRFGGSESDDSDGFSGEFDLDSFSEEVS